MAKTCLHCDRPVFSNKCCKFHQILREDDKYLAQKNKVKKVTPIKSSGKPIKKFTPKYQKEVNKYNSNVTQWKLDNPVCKYPGCNKPTEDCHHSYSRGKYINDKRFMIPLCREHHDECKLFPKKALELGLIYLRSAGIPKFNKLTGEDF